MVTKNEEPRPIASIRRVKGMRQAETTLVANELRRLGFRVEQSQHDPGPQAAAELALPPLVMLLFSGLGALGVLTLKKYLDGLLEEFGVKNLGTQTAKALKRVFESGVRSEIAYYRRISKKIEPSLDGGVADNNGSDGFALAGYCPPLTIQLGLGGDELSNPPWRLEFTFTRDLAEHFDQALELVSPVVREAAVMRDRLVRDLLIKIRNPERYYGRSLKHVSLDHELMEAVDTACCKFLFDVPERQWVRIASYSGVWSPSDIVERWYSEK
jgi:hypothetical protein